MELYQRINKVNSNSSLNKIANPLKNYSWQQDAALFGINWQKIKQKILKDNTPIEVMDGILHLFEEGRSSESQTKKQAEIEQVKEQKPISSATPNKVFMIKNKK